MAKKKIETKTVQVKWYPDIANAYVFLFDYRGMSHCNI